jgi:hypothetical protein
MEEDLLPNHVYMTASPSLVEEQKIIGLRISRELTLYVC